MSTVSNVAQSFVSILIKYSTVQYEYEHEHEHEYEYEYEYEYGYYWTLQVIICWMLYKYVLVRYDTAVEYYF